MRSKEYEQLHKKLDEICEVVLPQQLEILRNELKSELRIQREQHRQQIGDIARQLEVLTLLAQKKEEQTFNAD